MRKAWTYSKTLRQTFFKAERKPRSECSRPRIETWKFVGWNRYIFQCIIQLKPTWPFAGTCYTAHECSHKFSTKIWPQFIKTGIIISLKEASSVPQNKTQKT